MQERYCPQCELTRTMSESDSYDSCNVCNRVFPKEKETVNHPAHYGGADNPYEVIKVIEAWQLDVNFCLGNCVKYIARAGKKSADTYLEDLKKARWYLNHEIESLELKKS